MKIKRKKTGTNSSGNKIVRRKSTGRFNILKSSKKLDELRGNLYKEVVQKLETSQLEDEFESYYDVLNTRSNKVPPVIRPPYNLNALIQLVDQDNTIKACIDAIVLNSCGDFRLSYIGIDGEEMTKDSVNERETLEDFLENINSEYDAVELKQRLKIDKWCTGNSYLEVCRDVNGIPSMLYHVKSHTMRVTRLEKEFVEIRVPIRRNGKLIYQKRRKRFRRYVQVTSSGKMVYFKEFGDPRRIDRKTGEVNNKLNSRNQATEIIHFGFYHPKYIYGLPPWLVQILSILGGKEAEKVNYDFFKRNAIPAMAILIAGGFLTEDSIDHLNNKFNSTRGLESMNNIVTLEATSDDMAASIDGKAAVPNLNIKPLTDERQRDALFQQYEKATMTKKRSSFRLPPIFIGQSDTYSYATANTSFLVGDSQVFGPERDEVDRLFNKKILKPYDLKYWQIRSVPPRVVGVIETIRSLKLFNEIGAMTPNLAIQFANELFNTNHPMIAEGWGNYPFQICLELVKAGNLRGIEDIEKNTEAPGSNGGKDDPNTNTDTFNGDDPVFQLEHFKEEIIPDLRKKIEKFSKKYKNSDMKEVFSKLEYLFDTIEK